MTRFDPPAPPYVGPAFRSSSGSNKPIRRIVLHSTVSPCEPGMARKIGAYFRSPAAGGSAHYIVDPVETLQSVFDSVIAWHAPPNGNSLGVEFCDMPTTKDAERWEDKNHRLMFDRGVMLVAGLCMAYEIPPWFRGRVALRLGMRGVTTHHEVSQAFGQSTHWDMGKWPQRKFMRAVRAEIKHRKGVAKRAAAAQKKENR